MVICKFSRDEAEALFDAVKPLMRLNPGLHLETAFWTIVESCGMDSGEVEKDLAEG